MASAQAALALQRLDEITHRLRVECPWDREQDERSIVPHTVEEAYELADAAHSGDDAKMLDELGDVLFQVHFLAMLLEERGAGDLAAVADGCREKLIRRHPHVFGEPPDAESQQAGGDGESLSAGEVLANWDQIKSVQEGKGRFGDLPENLPATLYAKKMRRRAARVADVEETPLEDAVSALRASDERDRTFEAAGELLLAAVAAATTAGADPELALRAAADRHRQRAEEAAQRP